MRDRASRMPLVIENGHFVLPDAPGLGVEPNLDALAEMAAQPQPRSGRAGSLYW